jgi:hypothetical protein
MTTPFVDPLRITLLAAALTGAVSIHAQAAEPKAQALSRSQVHAEYIRARDAGELASPADLYRSVREALVDSRRTARAQAMAAEAPRIVALPVQQQASAAR